MSSTVSPPLAIKMHPLPRTGEINPVPSGNAARSKAPQATPANTHVAEPEPDSASTAAARTAEEPARTAPGTKGSATMALVTKAPATKPAQLPLPA